MTPNEMKQKYGEVMKLKLEFENSLRDAFEKVLSSHGNIVNFDDDGEFFNEHREYLTLTRSFDNVTYDIKGIKLDDNHKVAKCGLLFTADEDDEISFYDTVDYGELLNIYSILVEFFEGQKID